jgi:hypothetical protein
MGRVPIFVLALLLAFAACKSQMARVREYQPGTFYFDWDETDKVNSDQRLAIASRFERRVQVLEAQLHERTVTGAIQKSNAQARELQLAEILERDRRWQLAVDDAIVDELTDPACNETLRRFTKAFEGFAEILVTNARGANVCVTNRTTDYYQADEDWWQHAFTAKRPTNGHLAFDESAGVVAVPAYIPIRDPVTGVTIGVAKAQIVDAVPATAN